MDQQTQSESLLIAVAGGDNGRIDQHFGQAESFLIFRAAGDGFEQIERRTLADHARDDEDRRETIRRMLADCRVLLVAKIGPNPQEQLARAGIEATDLHAGAEVNTAVAALFAAKRAAGEAAEQPLETAGFQVIHTMLRVADLDRSLDFYCRLLGMSLIEKRDHQRNLFTQAYVGYPGGATLELVFNWTQEQPYVLGDAYGHIAIAVSGITALCDRLAAAGVTMPRPPRAQRHGGDIVAFVEDPDGHRIELVQIGAP